MKSTLCYIALLSFACQSLFNYFAFGRPVTNEKIFVALLFIATMIFCKK
ncbi:MAG: hypothetical protein QM581_15345 [Pseudomonas sp.]